MIKILHIPNFYPPHKGGIEDVCHNIIEILKKEPDVQQKVICFSGNNLSITDKFEDVDIVRVGARIKISSQFLSFAYYIKLKNLIKSFKPDYIHLHCPNPLVSLYVYLAIPKGTKLIIHWHSDIVDQRKLYKIVSGIEKMVLDRSNKLIATSPNYIEKSLPLLRVKEKVSVVPNIINKSLFEYNEEIKKKVESIKSKYQNKKIVLFVGRHVPYKGLRYLLKAVPLVSSDCVVLIGGSGVLEESLKSMNKDGRVHFIGRIPDDMLPAYYYAADVFAFPSITKNEAFGVALAEAMYCNTPAVTFTIDGSGVNWVNINGVTGLEVENRDCEAYAKALDYILSNDAVCKEMASNARQRVFENFVEKQIEEKIKKLYE